MDTSFKLLSTHHEEYCELLALEDQRNEVAWFDDLNQDVFNFKHNIHSCLRDSTDKSSSQASSKGSSRSKNSSRSTKASSSSKSSTKLKLLEEKAKIDELETEATFLSEKQKAENQAKMLQIQGEVARAKARARVYEDYNQMEVNSEVDEVESNVYEEKVQQRWRCKDQRQENLRANVEDNKSNVKVVPKEKKSKSLAGGTSKAIRGDFVEYGHLLDKNQSDMVAMISKLLRQQAAPDADINTFTSDPVDYHYFIAVFDEVVEKIDDPWHSLTRLIKYTDGQPKAMIKHCTHQPAAVHYKNARSLLEEKYDRVLQT